MIFFSTLSRGQQVLTPLGSEQTTSLLVVLILNSRMVFAEKTFFVCKRRLRNRKVFPVKTRESNRAAGSERFGSSVCMLVIF